MVTDDLNDHLRIDVKDSNFKGIETEIHVLYILNTPVVSLTEFKY